MSQMNDTATAGAHQGPLTSDQVDQFNRDGFVILPRLLDAEEVDLLHRIAVATRQQNMDKETGNRDAQGGVSRIMVDNDLHDNMYGALVRCRRIVDAVEQLLGDEVYHFHHKMMLKEPRVGGAWEWHQDYGYWYKNNFCLYPDMASCMIAVDRATRANGCLQVIAGSHRCGRIEIVHTGDQIGADLERVEALLQRQPLVYVELEPGDALIFHCNTLHRSDPNHSEHSRWSLICCYNTRHNDPYKEVPGNHPCYTPLEKWPDQRVKTVGEQQWRRLQGQ